MATATEFNLTIRLGNAEMQTAEDVARALYRASNYLQEYYDNGDGILPEGESLSILDQNGNKVGHWSTS
jgi:hypothetical protein